MIPQGSGGSDAGKALSDENLVMIGGDVTKSDDVEKVRSSAMRLVMSKYSN